MAASPTCEVRENLGPFGPTTNGVDVSAASTVTIRLADATDVTDWYLMVIGTDELSTAPTLVGVHPATHHVTTPTTDVTLTYPNGLGRAVLFKSTVVGVGGPLETTFAIFSLTTINKRVGAVNERREGNLTYGWSSKINPVLRNGASELYYNDGVAPPLGAATIQDALDAIKGALSSLSTSSVSINFACPIGIAVNDAVYISSAGTVSRAAATSLATGPAVGLVVSKPTPTSAVVRVVGEVPGYAGLVAGTRYYLASAPGQITATAPSADGSIIQPLGIAISTTVLLANVHPNFTQV